MQLVTQFTKGKSSKHNELSICIYTMHSLHVIHLANLQHSALVVYTVPTALDPFSDFPGDETLFPANSHQTSPWSVSQVTRTWSLEQEWAIRGPAFCSHAQLIMQSPDRLESRINADHLIYRDHSFRDEVISPTKKAAECMVS